MTSFLPHAAALTAPETTARRIIVVCRVSGAGGRGRATDLDYPTRGHSPLGARENALDRIRVGRGPALRCLGIAPRGRQTRPAINSRSPLGCWSFRRALQPRKQSRRGVCQGFQSCVAPAFHEQKQTTGRFGNVRKVVGEIRNVVC